ncbi:hypothetical protein H0G86_012920 [Trichoderma simmonsii]|uniref:Uncharacterized protein n=1 Tax=Trichoderma simmonsii TaxID=1491479 RepID=A0A8G0LUJ1_9HYPO|nr:hypothetical protein H0G86_012920 [Trichoderma simmonsii]
MPPSRSLCSRPSAVVVAVVVVVPSSSSSPSSSLPVSRGVVVATVVGRHMAPSPPVSLSPSPMSSSLNIPARETERQLGVVAELTPV